MSPAVGPASQPGQAGQLGQPVLVIGAGPAGLTIACTLHRFGVPCRVVDRRGALGAAPKALVLWSGALEALRRTGISDQLVAQALPLSGATYYSRQRRLGQVRFGGLPGTAFPAPLCLPQPVTEELLYERLRKLGGEVEWDTELVSLDQAADGCRAELRRPDGGTEQVRAGVVVGADGTYSQVREATGIAYQGRTYERVFLLGDGRLAGPTSPDHAEYHLHPDGVLVVVPLPGGGHRVFFDVAGGDDAPVDVPLLQRLLDSRGPGSLQITEMWWTSRFKVHARLADRFRQGRIFLAGDAAHCHSPAGGQGLNTGVQDGFDLGWKLASVLRGADASLLDSYQAERRPASARAVNNADRQTRLWMVRSRWGRALRDAAMRRMFRRGVLERRMVPQLAQLDLDHSGSPGVIDLPGAGGVPAGVRLGRRVPDALLDGGGPAPVSLHDYLAGGRHTLLVAGAEPAGQVAAQARSWVVSHGVGDIVDVLWVRPPGQAGHLGAAVDAGAVDAGPAEVLVESPPAGLTAGGAAWLAYLRPDGVVGARAGLDQLGELLARLPQQAGSGAAT